MTHPAAWPPGNDSNCSREKSLVFEGFAPLC